MLLAGNLLPLLTAVLTAPMTARALGVADRGVLTFSVVMAALVIVVAAAGLPWLSRARIQERPEDAGTWIRCARRERPVGVLVAVCAYTAVVGTSELDGPERIALALLFLVAVEGTVRAVETDALLVSGRARVIGVAATAGALVGTVLVVALFLVGGLDLCTALVAQTIGQLVQIVVVRRASRRWRTTSPGAPRLRLDLRERLPTWAAQISDSAVARADLLIVGFLGTAEQLGLYALASLLSQVAYVVITTTVLWSYVWTDSDASVQRLVRALRLAAAAWWPLAVLGVAAGYLLIVPVFGASFEGARHYMPVAALYALMLARMVPLLNNTSSVEATRPARLPSGLLVSGATVGGAAVAAVATGVVLGATSALVCYSLVLLAASVVLERRETGTVTLVPDFRSFVCFASRIEPSRAS